MVVAHDDQTKPQWSLFRTSRAITPYLCDEQTDVATSKTHVDIGGPIGHTGSVHAPARALWNVFRDFHRKQPILDSQSNRSNDRPTGNLCCAS
jgi:hypothetical protein